LRGAQDPRAFGDCLEIGCTSSGRAADHSRISAVAVWYSSASVSSAVRCSTLRSSPRTTRAAGAHPVELLGQALELVAGPDLDVALEIAGADLGRALLQRAQRPDQRAGEEEARRDRDQQAATRRSEVRCKVAYSGANASVRGDSTNTVQRSVGIGACAAKTSSPLQVARRAGGRRRADARGDLRQRAQVGLLQHQADVGMRDQHAVGVDDVGQPGRCRS
jgi:hypothetical protein